MFARVRVALVPVLAAVAVAGLAGLTGCSGSGDRPQTLPPLSTTPAATSSPEPTATGKKAELAAATAVVRQYFRAKNNLGQTMNASELASLETTTCSCRAFLRSIRATRAMHRFYFGRSINLVLTPALNDSRNATVLVRYDTTAGGTKAADGSIIFRGAPRHGVEALFTLSRHSGGWLILDIANVRPGRSQ